MQKFLSKIFRKKNCLRYSVILLLEQNNIPTVNLLLEFFIWVGFSDIWEKQQTTTNFWTGNFVMGSFTFFDFISIEFPCLY